MEKIDPEECVRVVWYWDRGWGETCFLVAPCWVHLWKEPIKLTPTVWIIHHQPNPGVLTALHAGLCFRSASKLACALMPSLQPSGSSCPLCGTVLQSSKGPSYTVIWCNREKNSHFKFIFYCQFHLLRMNYHP